MPERDGFSGWITIEGSVATEYATQILEEENKVSCWIASEAGKHFRVHFSTPDQREQLSVNLSIDGVEMGLLPAPSGTFSAVTVSPTEKRKFLFTTLVLTDDDTYQGRSGGSSGEISLELWTVEDTDCFVKPKFRELPSHKVHETSKKAGTHCAVLGELAKTKPTSLVRSVDFLEKLATISFHYQPLAVLQANEIAPRPTPLVQPSPELEISTTQAEHDDDTPAPPAPSPSTDEVNLLKEQLRLIQARLDAITEGPSRKRTTTKKDGPPAKRIKKEAKVKFIPGEVIDLTVD